ncbi:hypothetical protein SAMN05518800_6865 [Variovorax sp. YR752]|nr:hypothetical protein SAMN05518800_6865 [Variovorax sp. YR752]
MTADVEENPTQSIHSQGKSKSLRCSALIASVFAPSPKPSAVQSGG